ncbi:MAG TPA: prepilin-type N-terminal cleavage/methylation domain-containing protein [Geminicoccaceae bacterium]|nr:prepilin-type N-terminal cleavage/methylation domain-containing protein [Geminicoccaceae bacterium]
MWPWTGSPAGSGSGTEPAPRRARAAAGFTLIEVLIAFVILALALGALLPGFSTGLRGLDTADDYATAALLAESRLAAVGREEPLEEGTTAGEFDDRFRWRLDVTALPGADPDGVLPVLPYGVVLTVSWDARDDERSVVIETLRLGPPPRLGLAR